MHDDDTEITRSALGESADVFAVDRHGAGAAGINTGYDLAERRLAGAVLTEQGADLARFDADGHVIERANAGKRLDQIAHLETESHDYRARASNSRGRSRYLLDLFSATQPLQRSHSDIDI